MRGKHNIYLKSKNYIHIHTYQYSKPCINFKPNSNTSRPSWRPGPAPPPNKLKREDVKPHTQTSRSTVLMCLANNNTVHILHSCHMKVNLGILEPETSVERSPQNLRTVERWNRLYDINSEDTVARGSVIGSGPVLQAGRSRVQFPMRSLDVFNWSNPSSRTMALGSSQPLAKMSTRNLPGVKGRPVRMADITAICELIV
jgi:hypothetical protein